jgi:hypothetical protein
MHRTTLNLLLLAMGVLGVGAGVAALSRKGPATAAQSAAATHAESDAAHQTAAAGVGSPLNLSGEWRLDRAMSDMPRGGRGGPGMGRGREGRGDGRWGDRPEGGAWRERRRGDGAAKEGPRRGAGMRRFRLPEVLRIEHVAGGLQIADSSGARLQEIAIGARSASDVETPRVSGRWNGQRLEIQRPGRPGMTFQESWQLEDGGQALVIRTRVEPKDGSAPAREMKRVYRRVAES